VLCGFSIVGVGRGEMDKGQNAQAGPPTSWVPPGVYPSQNPASSEIKQPTSLWKRREGCSVARVAERGVAVVFGPTSLKRGEGLLSRLSGMVEPKWVARVEVVVVGWVGGRMKLNRDGG